MDRLACRSPPARIKQTAIGGRSTTTRPPTRGPPNENAEHRTSPVATRPSLEPRTSNREPRTQNLEPRTHRPPIAQTASGLLVWLARQDGATPSPHPPHAAACTAFQLDPEQQRRDADQSNVTLECRPELASPARRDAARRRRARDQPPADGSRAARPPGRRSHRGDACGHS